MKTQRWEQLDGVRAFAIALVVASHTQAFRQNGQGGLAVAFFFVLSGYLLFFAAGGSIPRVAVNGVNSNPGSRKALGNTAFLLAI